MSEPKVIYLGPACEAETSEGRTWAEDNPWPDCECGHRPVEYVLGETFERMKAERDALQLLLNAADQRIDDLEELLTEAQRSVDYHAGMQREDGGDRLYGLLARVRAALKQEKVELCQEIPGTSGMRLNMLANQGE